MANIVTIVGDEAFATTLHDGLLGLQKHSVSRARTADEVTRILADRHIDLAIVDVDLEDIEPAALVQVMREIQPELRVMWMPFLGSALSEELLEIAAQGILTKPFFMEELSSTIEAALEDASPSPAACASEEHGSSREEDVAGTADVLQATTRCGAGVPRQGQAVETLEALTGHGPIDDIVNQLALELDAEVVIVFDTQGTVRARAGHMSEDKAAELARVLQREIIASNEAAAFLKERAGHFTSSIHEGHELRVFSAIVSGTRIALAAVARAEIPIGSVRYYVRQAAGRLAAAIQGME